MEIKYFVPINKAQLHTISWYRVTTPNLEYLSQILVVTILLKQVFPYTKNNHLEQTAGVNSSDTDRLAQFTKFLL